ncbi:Kelch-like protein 31 [Mizuhopecten yessoensis]|uniref:Kelch-like protein 31 n=1 Tax=Mizuhopecten yessoensis TaxID=6573 RepID=A0A210PV63_MIZYE|nr:Kelch-like protein 31 [Mizuhopecten yessoensis]
MVDMLVDMCQRILVSMVTNENVVYIFNLAEMFCLNSMQKYCVSVMRKSLHEVTKSEDFIKLDVGKMTQIVRGLDLGRSPTYVAFCLRHWCSTECSRRDMPEFDESFLNLLVSEIQFNTVSGRLFIESFRHPNK